MVHDWITYDESFDTIRQKLRADAESNQLSDYTGIAVGKLLIAMCHKAID